MIGRPTSTRDLSPVERRFVHAMNDLWFGRFEFLRIECGELVLDPWPPTVRGVKFGSGDAATGKPVLDDFELKGQVAEFFEYAREVSAGEIRILEIRHGLPFSMEVELSGAQAGAREGGHRG
jgi:hypothetical protein